ncbi:MAG: penicillin-binding protein 2 [Oscillospiraceae bacterium]|nr:penicillin-binding protein 2 [Oscillospiraceae bacterium]
MKVSSSEKRIISVGAVIEVLFAIVIFRFFGLSSNTQYQKTASERYMSSIEVSGSDGMIYDTNMELLVNEDFKYVCVGIPSKSDKKVMYENAENADEIIDGLKSNIPFTFESKEYIPADKNVYSFRVPERYSVNQTAQHLIGYTSQGEGVSGIEYAYNNLLRENGVNKINYMTDGFGYMLGGENLEVIRNPVNVKGIVTTIDKNIQKICEDAGSDIECGAIVVTEVSTGNIMAMASFPTYSVYTLEDDIKNENSPMINRTLYSYSVGSIFKLVTAFEAISSGFEDFQYNCTGSIDIDGRIYRCHNHSGHGIQNLEQAMINSCNTYFIELSRKFDISSFREKAFTLGFGREMSLASGIIGSDGVLPTEKDLSLSGELANFSFGQGKLTATPLQISQMTCAIANYGNMPVLRVIKGYTSDRISIQNEKKVQYAYTMDRETAFKLQYLMFSAVNKNENSNAKPRNTSVGAKTSTAQTDCFDEDGNEIYNSWITGYFPADKPQYAVTVLIENGGYGNDSAAPVFREIVEKTADYIKSSDK